MSRCDLLELQGRCKRDPEGYRDDVLMQLQHYNALHGLFMLKPGKDFKEFADLVGFLAQVAASYKKDIPAFHVGLIELLDKHYALLDPNLRRSLVAALILLRNRGSVQPIELLPLFFRLFRCPDKQLRIMIFRHIVADIKGANKNKRDERLNRAVQNFLQAALKDENEAAAKKALAVITDLYRRNVWSDARTVNLVADACRHPAPRILVAALKFFLGQDEAAEAAAAGGDESDEDEEDKPKVGQGTAAGTASGVSKEDVYKAYNKGVTRTKHKKQDKLKRQMRSIRKANKKEDGNNGEARFAAMQLINDPQAFAEHLFNRLQGGSALKFDTKMLLIQVLSRVVGLHRLHLLHLYPFLQRYVQPNQREVTRLLAAAATACHELVPPDALEPLLRQLVNQFVHDRARPEVVAVGINTVREICLRCPLVMNSDLLQDLAQYKRARDKPVATAARALIALFRELAPGMLEKKDRGKGADLERGVTAYGEFKSSDRVEGAELLQKDIAKRRREEREAMEFYHATGDDSEEDAEEGDSGDDEEGEESDDDEAEAEEEEEEEEEEDDLPDVAALKKLTVAVLKDILTSRGLPTTGRKDDLIQRLDESRGAAEQEEEEDEEEEEDDSDAEEASDDDEEEEEEEEASSDDDEGDDGRFRDPITGRKRRRINPALTVEQKKEMAAAAIAEAEAAGAPKPKVRKNGILSLSELRRRHKAAAKAKREQEELEGEGMDGGGSDSEDGMLEQERILTPEDFKRIKALKTANQLSGVMEKAGAKKANDTAAEEMRAMLRRADRSGVADRRVDPDALAAIGVKRAHDKESRVASILAGREGREEFGSAKSRKNVKTGGTNNKEKLKRKNLPLAARVHNATKRRVGGPSKRVKDKQFKGRFRR